MRLDAACEITFDVSEPTPFLLMLRPRSGYGQWIAEESYSLSPMPTRTVTEYTDSYGNLCQRVITEPGRFTVGSRVVAETASVADTAPGAPWTPVEALPDYALQFLLPSRYCQSDLLGELALEVTAEAAPGYDQAEAIRAWIHRNIEYRYGSSDATTSAADTAQQRVGVCRDFVHLGMALCRNLSIPARMVVGYLYQLDPMDLHAWFEAFVGGRWYMFDATQAEVWGGRIAIAYGRDAADVAMTTQFGPARFVEMSVRVDELSGEA